MDNLPILAFEQQIIATVTASPVTVIAAETGAGKSTRVPLMLLSAGFGQKAKTGVAKIGITEPRRVAAMSVARYVAELHGTALGEIIGYQIGGERVADHETQVKFMTEGILLNELHSDPQLRRYEVVVVDEAHERGINQDLILALLKQVRSKRPELKIIIMSATIDEERFAAFFDNAPVIKVPGRVFPVDIKYLDEDDDVPAHFIIVCADKVKEIIKSRQGGDILVFLPDERSIKEVIKQLEGKINGSRLLPLYGNQAPDEQREVFIRNHRRRVILATNIAETSITIDGVVHVVDSGLIKAVRYVDASMSALQVMEHSQAGCNQRAGRAGRTQPGICHRLFTKTEFESRPRYTEPEIKRMSLDQVLLHLRVLGYTLDQVKMLEFMDSPGEERWDQAAARLVTLGAVDKDGQVTDDGRLMDRLPMAPMLGRLLITASKFGCPVEAATIVAGLTSRPVFVRPKDKEEEAAESQTKFKDPLSDGLTLLNVWEAWDTADQEGNGNTWARDNFLSSKALREIDRNRSQVLDMLEAEGLLKEAPQSATPDRNLLRKAICAGLLVNLCVKSGRFEYSRGNSEVFIFPGSTLFRSKGDFRSLPRFLVCAAVVETSKPFARDCTAMEESWLTELLPADACEEQWSVETSYSLTDDVALHKKLVWQGTVISKKEVAEFQSDKARDAIAKSFVLDTTTFYGRHRLNPKTAENHAVWNKIIALVVDSAQREALAARLHDFYVSRLTPVTTMDSVRTADISLRLEDWLTPDLLEKHRKQVEAEKRQAEEARARYVVEEAERRRLEEEQRQQHQEKIKPYQARINCLADEFRRLGDHNRAQRILSLQDDLYFGWTNLPRVEQELDSGELAAKLLGEENQEKIAWSELIWKTVLEQYPVCPLCNQPWSASGAVLFACQGSHDAKRLIPLSSQDEVSPSTIICQFTTDRDEFAAELSFDGKGVKISFARPRGYVWTGKKFKAVTVQTLAAILPVELVSQREQILKDLEELVRIRKELEIAAQKIREMEERVGKGQVKKLTFRIIDGLAACVVDGIMYQAAFGTPYPEAGETWYCRLDRELPSRGLVTRMVIPEIKVSGLTLESDLCEYEALLQESYPGLPRELLF